MTIEATLVNELIYREKKWAEYGEIMDLNDADRRLCLDGSSERPSQRAALKRLLNPRTVAFVGVSEDSKYAAAARRTMAGGTDVVFVHPKRSHVFDGIKTFPDLAAVDRPVDNVFSVLSAHGTVELVRQAAATGAAGVVTIAGGFAEQGEEGRALQDEMAAVAHAAGISVVGPNGIGMLNVPQRLNLAMLTAFERRSGGLSAVTHSGAMLGAIAAAGWRTGGVGLNLLISAGNEAVTDVADYLDYLVEDEATRVIALAIEKIRRPEAFFAAAHRALEAGKPIIAIKMGRSARGASMAASHTGTLTGDAWVYEVAFRQAGIQTANEIDELVDRAQFLEQLPERKWTPVNGLAVLTQTGGFAQLASDLGDDLGMDIPDAPSVQPWVNDNVPGAPLANPLDATGFASSIAGLWEGILREYTAAEELDTFILLSQHADWDEDVARKVADLYLKAAAGTEKPFVIAPLAGQPGRWLEEAAEHGVAVGNGLLGSFRGLQTMANFVRTRPTKRVQPTSTIPPIPRPSVQPILVEEGLMLPFEATMQLLSESGIRVAPYCMVPATTALGDIAAPDFPGPYVVKLADVAHRTEHGAVELGVTAADLAGAVSRLRAIATRAGLPAMVAIQPMLKGRGEAFVGIQGNSELGPLVAFGLGGVFVEVLNRIGGRLAPLTHEDGLELLEEFADLGILDEFRGRPAWDRDELASVLVDAGCLAASGAGWIDSIDINPLIITDDGPVAVDGLTLVRDADRTSGSSHV
ncbi:acetate--CoA ligase family protein [Nocardioides sp. WS12]|uniref:acetate--CoA ligase family protein n=1 Tax=Nocardioides sp. WS12 TaxID=2486272 RepID=UPI0015FC8E12|nr:acetate--CoA ligase family protein [Nocardioides sp. WS12]